MIATQQNKPSQVLQKFTLVGVYIDRNQNRINQ